MKSTLLLCDKCQPTIQAATCHWVVKVTSGDALHFDTCEAHSTEFASEVARFASTRPVVSTNRVPAKETGNTPDARVLAAFRQHAKGSRAFLSSGLTAYTFDRARERLVKAGVLQPRRNGRGQRVMFYDVVKGASLPANTLAPTGTPGHKLDTLRRLLQASPGTSYSAKMLVEATGYRHSYIAFATARLLALGHAVKGETPKSI